MVYKIKVVNIHRNTANGKARFLFSRLTRILLSAVEGERIVETNRLRGAEPALSITTNMLSVTKNNLLVIPFPVKKYFPPLLINKLAGCHQYITDIYNIYESQLC